jgi:hypothetical protein
MKIVIEGTAQEITDMQGGTDLEAIIFQNFNSALVKRRVIIVTIQDKEAK